MANDLHEAKRLDFLIAMYNQMMADINRHIVVVWQSVTVLVGAFAAWSLIEKDIISIDIAVTMIIGISAWVLAHVYDAAYWYNRNLVIIANIERQFLRPADLKEIHYYFGAHRTSASMLTHLRLQRALAIGVALLVLGIHFSTLVGRSENTLQNSLPYLAVLVALAVWAWSARRANVRYREFLTNSPGKAIDASGVEFGVGHPTEKQEM